MAQELETIAMSGVIPEDQQNRKPRRSGVSRSVQFNSLGLFAATQPGAIREESPCGDPSGNLDEIAKLLGQPER